MLRFLYKLICNYRRFWIRQHSVGIFWKKRDTLLGLRQEGSLPDAERQERSGQLLATDNRRRVPEEEGENHQENASLCQVISHQYFLIIIIL